MGTPLLIVGASAGKLLPKAGAWMETVKRFFGILFLGVAIWMVQRILPGPVALALWGVLLLTAVFVLGAFQSGRAASGARRVAGFFRAMEARLADALSRAKVAGKLADGVDPASAAKILVCFVEGLRVVGKTAPARATSQATADALLDRFVR